jgi:hypothetical protein
MYRGSSGFLFLVVLCCGRRAFPQWAQMPTTGAQPQTLTDRTIITGQSGLGPLITAEFMDKKHNASKRRAIIDVHTDGVQIIDPAKADYAPALSQAHIQYQVDGGTLVKTTSRRIEIDNLSNRQSLPRRTPHPGCARE